MSTDWAVVDRQKLYSAGCTTNVLRYIKTEMLIKYINAAFTLLTCGGILLGFWSRGWWGSSNFPSQKSNFRGYSSWNLRLGTMYVVCMCMCVLPLWEWRCSYLLSWSIHMAHHKVLSDLLHVLILEERVEAQLICGRRERERKSERETHYN